MQPHPGWVNREGKRWKGCRSLPEREMSPRLLMTLSSALYLTSSVFAGAASPVPSYVCYRAWKSRCRRPASGHDLPLKFPGTRV